jgi:hypothetical protein
MPGFVVHQGAQVVCGHGGQATPTAPNPRVKVSGMAVSTMIPPYVVSSCPLRTPCVTGKWVVASLRVRASGDPVVLFDSQAVTNTGAPLKVLSTQTRVQGQ